MRLCTPCDAGNQKVYQHTLESLHGAVGPWAFQFKKWCVILFWQFPNLGNQKRQARTGLHVCVCTYVALILRPLCFIMQAGGLYKSWHLVLNHCCSPVSNGYAANGLGHGHPF